MVCGGDASDKDSHASQLTTNNYEPSSNRLLSTTFKDMLQKETTVNFLNEKEFYENSRQSYWILKKKNFSVVYVLFINRHRLIGFKLVNYITLKALLSPDSTIESAVSYFFLSGLRPCLSLLAAVPLVCLSFTCSKFTKKNERLLAV